MSNTTDMTARKGAQNGAYLKEPDFTGFKALYDGCDGLVTFTFKGCKSLEHIELPDSITTIGDWAFYNCEKLSAIDLPSGLRVLKGGAFQGCASLKHVELPLGLTEIDRIVFANCPSLEELPEAPFCKYGFSEDVSKEVVDEEEDKL